uniref:SD15619p n=1 Tax=Drosophila melanogaster TaxID=7227 RepID=Q8MRX7_DROME
MPAAVVTSDDVAISIFRQLSGLLLVFCLPNISARKCSISKINRPGRPDRRALKMRRGSTGLTFAFVSRFLRYSTCVARDRHLVRILVMRIPMRMWVLTWGRLLLHGQLLHCLPWDRR